MSIQNRRAKFDYEIKETYVAGIVLESNEVKPLRSGKASIQSSFINEQKGEILSIILKLFQEVKILTSKRRRDLLKNFYLTTER